MGFSRVARRCPCERTDLFCIFNAQISLFIAKVKHHSSECEDPKGFFGTVGLSHAILSSCNLLPPGPSTAWCSPKPNPSGRNYCFLTSVPSSSLRSWLLPMALFIHLMQGLHHNFKFFSFTKLNLDLYSNTICIFYQLLLFLKLTHINFVCNFLIKNFPIKNC